MSLYEFKIQVPRTIPDKAVIDSDGRKWMKASACVTNEFTAWDFEPNTWFVWFYNGLDVPSEGDVVELNKSVYVVENVYRYQRLKRAIVTFRE